MTMEAWGQQNTWFVKLPSDLEGYANYVVIESLVGKPNLPLVFIHLENIEKGEFHAGKGAPGRNIQPCSVTSNRLECGDLGVDCARSEACR
jgi:hypothetical protein